MLPISTSRLVPKPDCTVCSAGALLSFNYRYARTTTRAADRRDLSIFVAPEPLRWGTLYQCKACANPWYLDGDAKYMHFVPRERVALIQAWNERPIDLSPAHLAAIEAIGRTPADLYGNGSQYREYPCSVVTTAGERIELAVVCLQRHPPFEPHRTYRLATEIAEIHPSPYALPRAVREATARAPEMRMGFSPTLVKLPDGTRLVINGVQNFFQREGFRAADVMLARGGVDLAQPFSIDDEPKGIVHFVADEVREGARKRGWWARLWRW
jgi:hypothetical protein